MNVKPMLGDWEMPHVVTLETLEQRALVEYEIPGQVGSLFHDMNSQPTKLRVNGSVFGDAQTTFLEDVRGKYQSGESMTFVSDIVTGTQVQYAVIESLHVAINAMNPDQVDYSVVLCESPPPPPPADPFGAIDTDMLAGAGDFLDSVTGALDALDALGSIPDIGDPTVPLTSTLDSVEGAMEELGSVSNAITGLFGAG